MMIRNILVRRLPDALPLRAAMRHVLGAAACAALLTTATAASGEERVQHFEAAAPESIAAARDVLGSALLVLTNAYEADLYADVHQASYSLEAAAERLGDVEDSDAVLLERLRSTIEIVHLASEIEDESILDAAVPRLKLVVAEALAASAD